MQMVGISWCRSRVNSLRRVPHIGRSLLGSACASTKCILSMAADCENRKMSEIENPGDDGVPCETAMNEWKEHL